MRAWRFRWGRRAQIARIAVAWSLEKNECSRFQRKSIVARSCVRRRLIRAARHPAKSAFPKRPATRRRRCCHPARCAILSTSFQTAAMFSRAQTRTGAQISAECSGCGQTTAPRLVVPDSWLWGQAPAPPHALLTVVSPAPRDKPPPAPCTHLNNTFRIALETLLPHARAFRPNPN